MNARERTLRESSDHLAGGERVLLSGTLHMGDGYEARLDLPGVLIAGYNAGTYAIKLDGTDEIVHAPRGAFSVKLTASEALGDDVSPADPPADEAHTDQQRVGAYLQQLNLDGKLNSFTASLHDQLMRRGSLSDKQVAAVMRDIEKAERTQQVAANAEALGVPRQGTPTVTEPGVYEKDEVVYVVKRNQDKTGLYAKQIRELNSTRLTEAGTVVEIEFDYAPGAIYKLDPSDKMPLERAKEFTIRYGRCIVCGRDLRKAESVERGIGPICIKSFG